MTVPSGGGDDKDVNDKGGRCHLGPQLLHDFQAAHAVEFVAVQLGDVPVGLVPAGLEDPVAAVDG